MSSTTTCPKSILSTARIKASQRLKLEATRQRDSTNILSLGTAHHGVDLLYIFLTYQAHLPAHLAKLAETVAGHWLSFINNKQPWTPYSQKDDGSSTLMMFGPEGASREVLESTKSAYKTLRLCEKLLDNIGRFEGALRGEATG
jgi:carboxylesterase type B